MWHSHARESALPQWILYWEPTLAPQTEALKESGRGEIMAPPDSRSQSRLELRVRGLALSEEGEVHPLSGPVKASGICR